MSQDVASQNKRAIKLFIVLFFSFVAPAFFSIDAMCVTEAESKRLEILQSEKALEEAELLSEQAGYLKEADKLSAFKRIEMHKRNIVALDVEIKNTGRMPEITDGQILPKASKEKKGIVATPVKRFVVPVRSGQEVVEVDSDAQRSKVSNQAPHQAWDVFHEF
jgi:hypothetical protein